MLTSAGVEAAPRGRAAIDRVLTKPVKHSELLEAIQSVMRPPAARSGRRTDGRAVAPGAPPARAGGGESWWRRTTDQSEGRAVAVEAGRPLGDAGEERTGGGRGGGRRRLRSDPHGRADAGHERTGSDSRDPRPGVGQHRTARPDHGDDGPCHGQRSGGVPAGRHGRLRLEADPARGAARRGRRHRRRTRRPAPAPRRKPSAATSALLANFGGDPVLLGEVIEMVLADSPATEREIHRALREPAIPRPSPRRHTR